MFKSQLSAVLMIITIISFNYTRAQTPAKSL